MAVMAFESLCEILRRGPTLGRVLELAAMAAPLWVAALGGLLLGWAWRPRWASAALGGGRNAADEPQAPAAAADGAVDHARLSSEREESSASVKMEDLRELCRLVDESDGGPAWVKMMERSLPTMSYRAWRRDAENGLPQYRSSTVFEDVSPEMVRDFFWDDDFRRKNGWDNMLLHHDILEENSSTGELVVRWVRKFPFFCSDREYIIARRIWASGSTYYCVTKGVARTSVPRCEKPRRVDLYYSSWCVRPVESARANGASACEVLMFHLEDMGIPSGIAKFGVQQGMWGYVQRIEPGLRAYLQSPDHASHYSKLAGINTKFNADELVSTDRHACSTTAIIDPGKPKHWTSNIPRFVAIGGAVAVACTLDRGLVTKAIIFGVARRFANPAKAMG